jgi:hypothetical protein
MTSWTKVAIDEGVCGQEALCLPRRLEALHLPFSAPRRSVRVLRSIVQVAALAVFDIGHQRTLCHPIAAELVGDENPRHILQSLQQPLKETLRCPSIAATLHQDIEHDPVLIDGTPEIMQLTPDPNEDLVHVPLVARPRPTPAELVRKARAEL